MPIRSSLQRFFEFVIVNPDTGCWEWQGSKRKGYGKFNYHGEKVAAHRWLFEVYQGCISDDKELCHSCDNPPCVYPLHLRECDHSENIKESWERTRR